MQTKLLTTTALVAAMLAFGVRAAEPDISAERFRAHVAYLADDLLEGREAGTRGHELAARYIATQFDLIGLKPGGENGGWYQSVGLAETSLTGPAPTVTITTAKGAKTYENASLVVVRGLAAGGETVLSSEAVFAGYGMTDKATSVDDYKGLDVHGKIVVVLRGIPKGVDSEIAAHLSSQQARFAAEHGAVGLVQIYDAASARTFPWKVVLQYANEPRSTWVQKDGAPFDDTYGLKARATIQHDAAVALFDGAKTSLDAVLDQADKAKRPKGFPLKARLEIKVATQARRYSSPEVIGLIEGADPKLKDEYVVLMGHADHLGIRPNKPGDNIYNGALDNAAGVATLLEVARAFATGERPRRSVLIIANTAEEKGLLGAEFWAHYPTAPAGKIVAGVDLDEPMLTYDFTDVVAFGANHSTLSDTIKAAGATMGVTLSPDPTPDQASFVRSDHYALVKVGIPAVMLVTGMQNGGQAAWDEYEAKHYHQPSDDLSQPIIWASGAKFAKLNYLVARDLADADQAPQWYAGDYFGDTFAPKASKAAKPAKPGK